MNFKDIKIISDKYSKPKRIRPYIQLIATILAYLYLLALIFYFLNKSLTITIFLSIINSIMIVRFFLIMHECGHNSFSKSKKINSIIGKITGFLSFTPYYCWTHDHSIHHANNGKLEKKGIGEIYMLTINEYNQLSKFKKFVYKISRNWFTLIFFGGFYMAIYALRIPHSYHNKKQRKSILITNIGILVLLISIYLFFGSQILLLKIMQIIIAGNIGVFLFYIQHQYENSYFKTKSEYNFIDAAIKGSSYFKLPRIIEKIFLDINYHHIHHLVSTIPNYNLKLAMDKEEILKPVKTINFYEGLKCFKFALWDEEKNKMIPFSKLK